MGNICRSPMAEGVFSDRVQRLGLADRISLDSAGTHGFNTGSMPDPRARAALLRHQIDIGGHRARQVRFDDFERFDYILAMDGENYLALQALGGPRWMHKLHLLLDFAPDVAQKEIPDPYFSGALGFDASLELIRRGIEGLLEHMQGRGLI